MPERQNFVSLAPRQRVGGCRVFSGRPAVRGAVCRPLCCSRVPPCRRPCASACVSSAPPLRSVVLEAVASVVSLPGTQRLAAARVRRCSGLAIRRRSRRIKRGPATCTLGPCGAPPLLPPRGRGWAFPLRGCFQIRVCRVRKRSSSRGVIKRRDWSRQGRPRLDGPSLTALLTTPPVVKK